MKNILHKTFKTTLQAGAIFGALATPTAGFADDYLYLYTQPMEGVYSQGWHTDYLREVLKGSHEIYVRGDGKMGDFFGILWLDCEEAKYSNWLSVGGYLTQDRVPIEVIRLIRKQYC